MVKAKDPGMASNVYLVQMLQCQEIRQLRQV